MRGTEQKQTEMLVYGTLEEFVPAGHPLRAVRGMTEQALADLQPVLEGMYAEVGRPSVPPEQMLRALLLQMLFTVRSERQLVEQLHYNMMFRWFVGLELGAAVWDATSFSKNRERLLACDVARQFFTAVLEQARRRHLLSSDRFTVDGTLIEAWASERSYQKKPGPPAAPGQGSGHDGEVLKRDTHASRTDPDATLYRKGTKSGLRLMHMAHALSENGTGLVVETSVSLCSPRQERAHGLKMVRRLRRRGAVASVGADKGYQAEDFVAGLQADGIEAHVPAYRIRRKSWTGEGVAGSERFADSQRKRKWIERFFSWLKNVAGLRKTRHRGHRKLEWNFTLAAAAYNMVRMAKLPAVA